MGHERKTKEVLLDRVNALSEKELSEVLTFVEFLRVREQRWFVDYVNERTSEALEAKRAGEKFVTLGDLQRELAPAANRR